MIIQLNNVSKRYTNHWIIRNANYCFDQPITYGIKGANGSGKSTFLQLLSGYLSPSEGELAYTVENKTVPRGDVYQYINMTAPYIDIEEVFTFHRFLAHIQRYKTFEDGLSMESIIEKSGLSKHSQTEIEAFSSGMKQRVKLITALATRSEVVLLDEPTSYLDQTSKGWIYDLIKQRLPHKMIIIATNDAEDLEHCDVVIPIESFKVG